MRKSNKKELLEELAQISNSLPPEKLSSGFRTPDNYFETLPSKIRDKMVDARASQTPVARFNVSWKPAMVIAAVIVAVALTTSLLILRDGKHNGQLAGLDDAFYAEYLVSYAAVDPHFFYDMVLESDLSTDEILFGVYSDKDMDDDHALFDYVNSLLDYYWTDTESLLITDN